MIRKLAITVLPTIAVVLAIPGPAAVAAQESVAARDDAARFGARAGIQHMSLSPDGRKIAFIVPLAGRANALFTTAADGTGEPERILLASGDPERLSSCGWVSNDRLACNIVFVQLVRELPVEGSRMVGVDAAGGNVKMLSRREGVNARGIAQFGGDIIDWLPGTDGAVLMGRVFVPEGKIGSLIEDRRSGYGVERVDTRSGAAKRVENPRNNAAEYISDGRGNVRIMGVLEINESGYVGETRRYLYRAPSSENWQSMGEFNVASGAGFNPYAVDPKLNVAYGFRKKDGRQALFKLDLDGSLSETLVYAHPEVDVDGLVRIGRGRRVVGVSYATEKRHVDYFDPELAALQSSLSKALPGQPLIALVESNEDESKLLVWAGSDTDPGHYYLLDRATKKMGRLMASRPGLDGIKLAAEKPITYTASDGTKVPGYLTLPAGSTGKNIPAIVMPHGGPGARDEWGFDWLAQYYAHRGYAVLQPNFRGSAGYGDAWFQRNGFQSWKVAIGDVVDAGRWLVKEGIADPGKLAIVGWSYGGYAALQSNVVAPDLFKAAVAIAPVTDLEQLLRDELDYSSGRLVQDFIGSGPHLREGSPAQNAAAIKAPVMLFHGTLDRNVLVNQSKRMSDRLRSAGRDPQLVIYDGLDHQLEDDTARADMLRRSDQFIRAAFGN